MVTNVSRNTGSATNVPIVKIDRTRLAAIRAFATRDTSVAIRVNVSMRRSRVTECNTVEMGRTRVRPLARMVSRAFSLKKSLGLCVVAAESVLNLKHKEPEIRERRCSRRLYYNTTMSCFSKLLSIRPFLVSRETEKIVSEHFSALQYPMCCVGTKVKSNNEN